MHLLRWLFAFTSKHEIILTRHVREIQFLTEQLAAAEHKIVALIKANRILARDQLILADKLRKTSLPSTPANRTTPMTQQTL